MDIDFLKCAPDTFLDKNYSCGANLMLLYQEVQKVLSSPYNFFIIQGTHNNFLTKQTKVSRLIL